MPTGAEAPFRSNSWTLWPVVLSRIGRQRLRLGAGPSIVRPEGGDRRAGQPLDATLLARTDTVVRNRRDVADRGDLETDRLQRAQGALAAGAGALHVDLEHAHAVL